jgi:UDP-glucose 4-epimerase
VQILKAKEESDSGLHLVLMFGLGMIGSSIRDGLHKFDFKVMDAIAFDWQKSTQWSEAFKLIEASCKAHHAPVERLSVVWSAGKGGFHTLEGDIALENAPFEAVVQFIQKMTTALDQPRLDFHYISSAGGLFEGQRVVCNRSIPAPKRPYGHLKLNQENVLQQTFGQDEISLYRPSSVYGPMRQRAQQGLINNLISNGRSGRTTVLDAHIMSLRDYVFCGDIGRFVAKRIRFGRKGIKDGVLSFLVSSRCASIFEVVGKIEQILKLKLSFRYDESFGNHSNITFSDSVLPPAWSPSTLEVGIRQFLMDRSAS